MYTLIFTRSDWQTLIDNGAHIDAQDRKKVTALMLAAKHGHQAIVQVGYIHKSDVHFHCAVSQ